MEPTERTRSIMTFSREGSTELIADRLEEGASMLKEGRPHQLVVASASRMASGWRSQKRVLPSIFVKRNVTVPVGSSAIDGLRQQRLADPATAAVITFLYPQNVSYRVGVDPNSSFCNTVRHSRVPV